MAAAGVGRRTLTRLATGLAALLLASACAAPVASTPATPAVDPAAEAKPMNVLFIAVDDLRPELGCYGSPDAVTPNLDALAARGLRFNRAYCQQAICGPSRASLMTGLRPDASGVTTNSVKFRDTVPDVVTLPQHFAKHGYETVFAGKIYHSFQEVDNPHSWTREAAAAPMERYPLVRGFALEENQQMAQASHEAMVAAYGPDAPRQGLGKGPAWECADVPDHAYDDGRNTERAIATLRELVGPGKKPFFLALGLMKPHLDWTAPKRYWDLYDRDALTVAATATGPAGGAEMALHPSFELRARANIAKSGPVGDARTLRHAYLACVSYGDAQIGQMLTALDEAGVRDNTIIIVWGDHGWHLGDMGVWGKATNYEVGTRVPLIVVAPGMPAATRGAATDALAELIDMYPTLTELAGLEVPAHVEGQSLVPLLNDLAAPQKTAAFSQFPTPALREWASLPLSAGMRETYFGPLIEAVEGRIIAQQGERWDRELFENYLMGYAMRTDDARLVVWKDTRDPDAEPVCVELYEYGDATDGAVETVNVADEKPARVAELLSQFNAGWRASAAR